MAAVEQDQESMPKEFDGNRLGPKNDDRFGFRIVSKVLADAVTTRAGRECLVVGLEGAWGSGKSTLLAMLSDELESRGEASTTFAPWLIGSRDGLLAQLFSALERAIAAQLHQAGDATGKSIVAAKDGIARFKAYSSAVAGVGRLASFVGSTGLMPGADLAGKGLEALAETMKGNARETTLEEVKTKTAEALGDLQQRIVVTIDDLDRLEPSEAVEVLRLVQAVADFPQVSYVLSYDRARLAKSVEAVTGLDDGDAYLEKLVQVVVPLPQTQPVALIDMFTRRLKDITEIEEFDDRLVGIVTSHLESRITTPRSVVRVLDSFKLLWPELGGKVDLADLVWLQMVRAEDHRIYRWIEAYVAETARSVDDVARAPAKKRFADSIDQLLRSASRPVPDWSEIRSFLPMIASTAGTRAEELFAQSDKEDVLTRLKSKRLSSLAHARLFFALLPPDGRTAQKELEAIIAVSGDGVEVARHLVSLSEHRSEEGPAMVELVLDLLRTSLPQRSRVQLVGLSIGLLSSVDDVVRLAPVADRRIFRTRLSDLLGELCDLLSDEDWSAVLDTALEGDKAVDLLTYELPTSGMNRASWMTAEHHAERVHTHLAGIYARMNEADMVGFAQHGRILDAWGIVGEPARHAFLERVLRNDALFKELMLGLFRNRVSRVRESSREFGAIILVREVDGWWGLDIVRDRILQLDGLDADEQREFAEVLRIFDVHGESEERSA